MERATNKKIINSLSLTIVLLFAVGFISAITIYPGETINLENELGIENIVYTIIGNSTFIGDLNMVVTPTNISITFPQDMIPDNFQIIFLKENTNTIIQTVNVGGGGGGSSSGGTRYVDRNITKYIDNEIIKEVPGNTVEVEKIVKKTSWVLWSIIIILLIIIIYFVVFKEEKIVDGRYE